VAHAQRSPQVSVLVLYLIAPSYLKETFRNFTLAFSSTTTAKHLSTKSVPQPIFILGGSHSFTSLIGTILGQHPQTYGVSELNLFVADTLEQVTKKFTDILYIQIHGLLRTISQIYTGEQTILSIDTAKRWLLTHYHWTTAEIYSELCRKVAPLRIVDHSRSYSSNPEVLERIRLAFPEAHYLHVVRHPRSQGEALVNDEHGNTIAIANNFVDNSTNPPTLEPQIGWYRVQRTILDFLNTIPETHQMQVRSEDVLNEPLLSWQKICCWLNLGWDESMLDIILHPENSPYANFGPFSAHLGTEAAFLRSPTIPNAPIELNKLDGPLSWRFDGKGFLPHVIHLAQELGYD
jgi:hypothetical protein